MRSLGDEDELPAAVNRMGFPDNEFVSLHSFERVDYCRLFQVQSLNEFLLGYRLSPQLQKNLRTARLLRKLGRSRSDSATANNRAMWLAR